MYRPSNVRASSVATPWLVRSAVDSFCSAGRGIAQSCPICNLLVAKTRVMFRHLEQDKIIVGQKTEFWYNIATVIKRRNTHDWPKEGAGGADGGVSFAAV